MSEEDAYLRARIAYYSKLERQEVAVLTPSRRLVQLLLEPRVAEDLHNVALRYRCSDAVAFAGVVDLFKKFRHRES